MPTSNGPAPFAMAMERIAPTLELVEQAMRAQLASESPLIAAMGDHLFAAGGKRVRPGLLLFAAELCGYTGPRRIQLAAAIEFLHTASLIHDDVVDGSELRRGRPTPNSLWGNRRAVLVGDFFLARSSAMTVEDGDLDVLWLFADTIRRMAEGELLQLQYSFDPDVTEANYYQVIERKSALLFSAACEAGAIIAGVTRSERRRLAEFGREMGLAFQLRDDALDYEAGADQLGKPPYADLGEGKVTLPLLLTLKRCTATERAEIAALLKDVGAQAASLESGRAAPETIHLEPVVRHVERYRGVVDTVRRAREHVARATAAIAPFPDGAARQALLAAADFAVVRGS
ncbi:MAG: polyprenyl synthetase family protein [Deltaproteobacteria bacterium]|nr:MAG: polyprenyl synthetase family protein [Deltaproteobacteria bacterium]